jgi:hypothetical protein
MAAMLGRGGGPELSLIASGIRAHCDPSLAENWEAKCLVSSSETRMPSRAAKLVSAVFAGVLAGIPIATISHGAGATADECLSGPKDQAAQGSHWHYHIDHATKRHCWYLKDEHEKLSQAAPSGSSGSAQPMASKVTIPRSTADAHAELPAQAIFEQPKRSVGPAAATVPDTTVAAPSAGASRSVVASRWLDQSDTGTAADPVPPTGNSDAATPPDSVPAPSDPAAVATLAAADLSAEKQSGSIQTLLLVIIGASALAGLIGSAVFRFGNARWRKRPVDRRAIWDSSYIERPSLPIDASTRIGRDDFPWELRTADDPNGRIEDMLARLARSATA